MSVNDPTAPVVIKNGSHKLFAMRNAWLVFQKKTKQEERT